LRSRNPAQDGAPDTVPEGKISISGENLVRDAVWSEPVSGTIFPAFRESFREIARNSPLLDGD
jgi:hypothetical protein